MAKSKHTKIWETQLTESEDVQCMSHVQNPNMQHCFQTLNEKTPLK